MLKHDIKNYFRQFMKTLIICYSWNTKHTNLVMCNYAWPEQLNACAKYGIFSDKNLPFVRLNL